MPYLTLFENLDDYNTLANDITSTYEVIVPEMVWVNGVEEVNVDSINTRGAVPTYNINPSFAMAIPYSQLMRGLAFKLERPLSETDYIVFSGWVQFKDGSVYYTYMNRQQINDGILLFDDLGDNTYAYPTWDFNYFESCTHFFIGIVDADYIENGDEFNSVPPTLTQQILGRKLVSQIAVPNVSLVLENEDVKYNDKNSLVGSNNVFPDMDYSKLPMHYSVDGYYPEAATEIHNMVNQMISNLPAPLGMDTNTYYHFEIKYDYPEEFSFSALSNQPKLYVYSEYGDTLYATYDVKDEKFIAYLTSLTLDLYSGSHLYSVVPHIYLGYYSISFTSCYELDLSPGSSYFGRLVDTCL